MDKAHLQVKYYSRRGLELIDFNWLLRVLLEKYGDPLTVEFTEMSEEERNDATDFEPVGLNEDSATAEPPIGIIRDRFRVFEIHHETVRQPELERMLAARGRKRER